MKLHQHLLELPNSLTQETALRFSLAQADQVWWVQRGSMEVFYVQEQAEQAGELHHLSHVAEGGFVFGMGDQSETDAPQLLAIRHGEATIYRFPRELFEKLQDQADYQAELAKVIDGAINNLGNALIACQQPKKFAAMASGGQFKTQNAGTLVPTKQTLWFCISEGRGLVGDKLVLDQDAGFLPLAPQMVLRLEAQAAGEAVPTLERLKQGTLWQDLARFHQLAQKLIAEQNEQLKHAERLRLQEKMQNDRIVVDQALRDFSGIFKKEDKLVAPAVNTDPHLFVACKLVATMAHIELNHEVIGELKDSRDPVGAITRAANISKREVLLTGNWWQTDNGPLLAYLRADQRPVALLPLGPRRYEIVDPETKTSTEVTRENFELLEPKAVMLYRPLPGRKLGFKDLVVHASKGMSREFLIIIAMGLLSGLIGTVTPFVTGIIFDRVIPEAARTDLAFLAMGLAVVAFSTGLFYLTRSFAMLRLEGKIDIALQAAVWDRIMSLPVPFFRQFTAGDLVIRAMNIDTIRRTISGSAVITLLSGVFSVFYFFQLFYYSWKMALLGAGLILLALFPLLLGLVKLRYERQSLDIQGRLSGMVFELINGIAKLRISGAESRAFALWAKLFRQEKHLTYKAGIIDSVVATWNAAFSVVSLIAIYAFMVYLKGEGQALSLGNFLAFYAAFNLFMAAILEVSSTLVGLLNLIPAYERAKPILQTLPEESMGASQPGHLTGVIEGINLAFRYEKYGPLVLDEVSFKIEPGQFVAIVGPSGAGKSTLFRLLLGFENPEKGAIYYDGQELSGLDIRAVRRQVGVVLQYGKLLSGSIFENIVGSLPLTQEDAWEAARMAGLDQDIKEMPMGMHTVVSDSAGSLSGGQIQRVLIARALVNKPRILFFDEATSALDNQTQAIVTQSLDAMNITRIVIAHRLSTIINADCIMVIDKGRLVEQGTYAELIAKNGLFAKLAKRQIA